MSNRANGGQRRTTRDRLRARRPRFDFLEERQLLATFTVLNANDAGAGSLRQAILDANAAGNVGGADLISFNIPGGGFKTISPASVLPSLDEAVIIDGYTQPSATANTSPDGTNAQPQILLVGTNIPAATSTGLTINSTGVAIRGLVASGFRIAAIADTPLGGNALITGNFLGPTAGGDVQLAGGNTVAISLQTGGNTIGGTTSFATRNLISGNIQGVLLTGSLSTANIVAGNLIGSTATGLSPIQNTDAVTINAGSTANTIGGLTTQSRNIISGNVSGVRILGDNTSGNLVIGNYVGTDASGNTGLFNVTGIQISAPGNTVGGGSAQTRNIISGNTTSGVLIDGSASANATANVVSGNFIGLNVTGTAAVPNGSGVTITNAFGNTLGGIAASLGNVVSGNAGNGVVLSGAGATGNVLASNRIGTNAPGTSAVPNALSGIVIDGATSTTIGGVAAGSGNVVSGNGLSGVVILTGNGPGSSNVIAGNFIGTDVTGGATLGNVGNGVSIGSPANTVGGTTAGARNVISGNGANGVTIELPGASGNAIAGNRIGTDLAGGVILRNIGYGVNILSGANTTVGGVVAGAANLISGNVAGGVRVGSPASAGSLVAGNLIGTNASGNAALGNFLATGVLVENVSNVTVGGTIASAGNLISGNANFGVTVGGDANVVAGNRIGTTADGSSALANREGVFVAGRANTIGGSAAGAGNVISGNSENGLHFTGNDNVAAGNFVGLNATGDAAVPNLVAGIFVENATGITLGGLAAGARNVISGNGKDGVTISGAGATGGLIVGNYIGTNAQGSAAVPNGLFGVTSRARLLTIGGTTASARNIISGNIAGGIDLFNFDGGSSLIVGNYIGTNAAGTAAVPNSSGVVLLSPGNTLGGTTPGARNVIAGNSGSGVSASSTQRIIGNYIGTDATGLAALANQSGITVDGGTGLTIGGTTSAEANVISGNQLSGVQLQTSSGSLVQNTLVSGNLIGVGADGSTALGNGALGVSIFSASGNTIGGTAAGARNVIANNGSVAAGAFSGGVGVRQGVNNAILGNSIFANVGLGIDLGNDGVTTNDPGDPDTGPNGLQNFPVLQSALAGPGSTRVVGALGSTPNSNFEIQFFASDAADPSAFGEGQFYLGSTMISTDAAGSASFDVGGLAGTSAGRFVSAVAIALASGDSSEFGRNVVVANAATDLAITMTNAPDPVEVGQVLTYTITVTNNGPNDASGVTVLDVLPASVTFISASTTAPGGSTSFSAGLLTADLGSLAAGATATVTILVRPNTPGPISNSATVSSVEGDFEPSNNTATATATVIPSANLGIAIAASPSPVLLGQVLTYTITVTNAGPSTATNVVVTDTLPSTLIFVSAATVPGAPGGTVAQNGQLVTATFLTILSGQTATLTIRATPTTTGSITNSAQVSGTEADPVAGNNSASTTSQVNPSANLALTVSASPVPGLVGQPLTYTVTARNNGLSDASNVVVTDTLPSSVTFVSASAPGALSVVRTGQSITATFAGIPNGQAATLKIVGTPTIVGRVTNQAAANASEGDPDLSDNTVILDTTIAPAADLAIVLGSNPNPVFVGGVLQYTLTVTNNGPNTASGVIATDTLPAGVALLSVLPSQGTFASDGKGVITLNFGGLASGGKATARIAVRPGASAAGTIIDTASVTATEADPILGNNTASITTTVVAAADLALTLADSPDPVPVGSDLTYTLVATNNGPSTATNVQIVNTLPAGVTLIGVITPGSFSQAGSILTILPGSINSGASATITIVVRPTPSAAVNIVNSASITSDVADANAANNVASATTRVVPSADLSIVVTPSDDPLLIGGTLVYTIIVANAGPSDADSVTVADTFPAGAVFVGQTRPDGTNFALAADGKSATFSLFAIPSGTSKTVTLSLRPTTTGSITNVATVSGGQADPNPLDNVATTITTVSPSADVLVTLSALPSTVLVGQPISFTADVVNRGPSTTSGVVLTAIIPAGVSIANVTTSLGTFTRVGQTITVTIPSMANGALATLFVNGAANSVGVQAATASVTSAVEDPNLDNNASSATLAVIPSADLAITETVSADPAPLRGLLTYTVTVTNLGPNLASNVVLTNVLPAGAEFVSATLQDGTTYTPVGGVLTATIGLLPVDSSAVLTIVVRPTLIGTLNNTASVSADQADTVASNSTNVQLVTVAGLPGAIGFASPTFAADEDAGVVVVTLTRTGGADGAASVNVATSGGSAVAGVNYVATTQNVLFADGQSIATFSIPLLDDGKVTGDLTVGLLLSNPSGGAALGSPSSAVLTIVDTDSTTNVPPTEAPLQVTTLQRFGIHTQPTRIVLTFSGPLNAATATNRANYSIIGANGVAVPITSALYDATASTVTLFTSRQLSVFKSYRLVVRGTGPGAITTPGGVALDGNRDNTPGGDYTATINASTLAPTASKARAKVVAKAGGHAKATTKWASHAKATTKWASHLTGRNGR